MERSSLCDEQMSDHSVTPAIILTNASLQHKHDDPRSDGKLNTLKALFNTATVELSSASYTKDERKLRSIILSLAAAIADEAVRLGEIAEQARVKGKDRSLDGRKGFEAEAYEYEI